MKGSDKNWEEKDECVDGVEGWGAAQIEAGVLE